MDLESLRIFCLSLPGATEQIQWESDLLFKVGGKMFVVTGLGARFSLSFKCTPEKFGELVEREDIIPAPYLAKHNWVALRSEKALSTKELKDLIRGSYDLVFAKLPKKARLEIESKA